MARQSRTILLIISAFLLMSTSWAITIKLTKGAAFCVSRDLEVKQRFVGSYAISGYNEASVELKIHGPASSILQSSQKQKEGDWDVEVVATGEHRACFKNNDKRESYVTIDMPSEADLSNTGVTVMVIEDFMADISDTVARVKKIKNNLGIQKTRGTVHTKNLANLQSQINWSALFKTSALLLISIGQAYILTGFFRKQRKLFV